MSDQVIGSVKKSAPAIAPARGASRAPTRVASASTAATPMAPFSSRASTSPRAAAGEQGGRAEERDRRRAELARGGEPEARHARQAEAHREPGEQALAGGHRQGAERAQREEPRGGGGGEREHEEDQVGHRSPRYPSQYIR